MPRRESLSLFWGRTRKQRKRRGKIKERSKHKSELYQTFGRVSRARSASITPPLVIRAPLMSGSMKAIAMSCAEPNSM